MAYNSSYNGNVIYYDPYQTINATNALGNLKNDALEQSDLISQDDQYFNSVPERYSCLIPNPRYDGQKPYIDSLVTDAYDKAISTLSTVTNAIIDYCNEDGVFSEESKAILDSYLKKKTGSPSGDGSGGGGAGSGVDSDDLTADNEEVGINDSDINKVGPYGDGTQVTDEELVVSEIAGAAMGAASGLAGLETGTLTVSEQEDLLNEFGESLLGTSLNIPSPVANSIEKLSKSGVFGTAALAAIAVAGIGGKVFYDKKNDDDEEENDILDDDILSLNKKSGSSVNSGFISGSSIALKHGLLETGEVVE